MKIARTGLLVAVPLAALLLAGCNDLPGRLTGAYTGPQPSRESLSADRAQVVSVQAGHEGQVLLILDRGRFRTADPHNVNRIIKAWSSEENEAEVTALGLARGEDVVLSTEFSSIEEMGGPLGVPDWPGHSADEYPIGSHRILSIARAGP